jgi:hypothetical protein
MKLADAEKMTLASTPSPTPSSTPRRCTQDESLFFRAMIKAAGIVQKEMEYDLRVSHTLVNGWMNGTKKDPFTQARNAVKPFLNKGRKDLLPAILIYIAGGDNFDEVVLDRIQQIFAKVVQP